MNRRVACLIVLSLLVPSVVGGYAIEVHKDFYDHAFQGRGEKQLIEPPAQTDLDAMRRFVYERGMGNAEFARRWPTFESFSAAAFKELLQLNPGKDVVGIDYVPEDRAHDVRTIVREGSVDPDNDDRNQDRFWLDGDQIQLDPYGRAIPFDPRTVWFGGLTGTPSQFDAHGATLRSGTKSDSIKTALCSPEQFARPAEVMGSAPEFSETYTMLAQIAKLWGGEGSEWLALSFGGNNMHGLEDLGNQIHTTLIGTGKFFVDAQLTMMKSKIGGFFRRSKSGDAAAGGFGPPASLSTGQVNLAMALVKAGKVDKVDEGVRWALGKEPKPAEGLTEIGIRIIGNHHRLLEDYVQSQYLAAMEQCRAGDENEVAPHVRAVIQKAQAGDPEFEATCRAALEAAGYGSNVPGETPFARLLAEAMIEASAPEAQPTYEAIRAIAKKELRRKGTYDEKLGHDVLDFLVTTDPANEHVKDVWSFTGRAFARVSTVLRLWDELFRAETEGVTPGSPEAIARAHVVIDRLIGFQLERLQAAEARRAAYVAEVNAKWEQENGELPAAMTGFTQAMDRD